MVIELLCAKYCIGHSGVERQQDKISGLKEGAVYHEIGRVHKELGIR